MDIQQPEGIQWVSLSTAKVHAVPTNRTLEETFCGRPLAQAAILEHPVITDEQLCGRCERSLRAYGYLYAAQPENRRLIVPGVYLSNVAAALNERDIPLTQENIEAAATHVESIASAYAKAVLQNTSHEEWLEWIETFKQKEG